METFNIYQDIAERTGGDIYIGVVGPVRTGKSTFIKRFMDLLVLPHIANTYTRERAKDELPQSASGRTIMTTEPKFVPNEAVEISLGDNADVRVRMIDCVGYLVPGAEGDMDGDSPRMVHTPWAENAMPFREAAELGTKKVMEGHCSIGIVVTTDGTITEIPREDYVQAEKRAITDMQKTGKPFLVIVNSRNPAGEAAGEVKAYLQNTFALEPIVADCQALDAEGIGKLMKALLYTFPMSELRVHLPRWMDALEPEHPVKAALYQALLQMAEEIHTLGQAEGVLAGLRELPQVQDYSLRSVDLGSGSVICAIVFPEALFYEILSARAGMPIRSDAQLLQLLTDLSRVKQEYDKISDALSAVRATGYGVVMPAAEEMKLETPEIIRKGGAYGVKLKAGAPSIHMVRVDIDTEINPMVGDEKQSQDLVNSLMGEDPEKLWQSNIFGKSVYDLIQEGLTTKLLGMPEEVRGKFRGTLTRIVNEGATGLICLIL